KRVEGQVLPVRPIVPPEDGASGLDDVPELGLSDEIFADSGESHDESEHDESGHDESGHDESGHDESGHDESGHDGSGHDDADAAGDSEPESHEDPEAEYSSAPSGEA